MADDGGRRGWNVEDLEVFKRAYRLSLDLHRASLGFPKIEQYAGLADQLRRASKSVCALIVEGSGRQSSSPKEFARYLVMGLGDEIRRASKSICANVAEGFGKQRRSRAESRRYLLMAIGSADEMQVWMMYCADLGYVDRDRCSAWQDEYRQIARMLQGLYSAWGETSDH